MPKSPWHGAKPGLLRQLGLFSSTALVISNMVGVMIFGATGYMAGQLGSARLILACWAGGAIFALAGALVYSELGINFPSSGGEYVYLTQAFGPEWGFMSGWISFFAGFSAPIAAAALAFSDYLGHVVPGLEHGHSQFGGQVVASVLILAFTILNCVGIGRTAQVQNFLTGSKLVVLLGFIVLGLTAGSGSWAHFSQDAVRTTTVSLPTQFFESLLWVSVGYSGWNAATYVAEEVVRPERTLPLALAIGCGTVAALYLAINVVYIYSTPLESMKGEIAVGSLAASNLFGPKIAAAFSALLGLCIISTVNAMVTVGPRVYYAMAKNRAFFSAAAAVHPRWHTPVFAILSQGLCAMLMTLTPFSELVVYIGWSLTLFTVLAVGSLWVFRRNRPGWQRLRALDFAYPLIPAAYVIFGCCMMAYGIIVTPGPSLTALATVVVGIVVYRFRVGRNRSAAPPV